jgi:hypothetical protein
VLYFDFSIKAGGGLARWGRSCTLIWVVRLLKH